MKLVARLVSVAFVAPLLAGCVAGPKPAKGDKLFDVRVATLDGKATTLSRVIAGRAVVFKFGATWCEPCTRQLAELNRARGAYPSDRLAVIDIDLGEPAALVKRHAAQHGVTFTTVLDPTSKAATVYGVTSIPVTFVAAPDGTVLYRGGYTTFGKLKAHIDEALAASP